MHSVYKCVTLTLAVFVSIVFHFSWAQNCAIPQIVQLAPNNDVRTECASTGTVLTSLTAFRIKAIKNITQTVKNFANVVFTNSLKGIQPTGISVVVGEPLFSGKGESFIDETWSSNVTIKVVFECEDGREKTSQFIIPIADENTQPPFFQQESYSLITGPCYNGTHIGDDGFKYCPLNFETPILVFDGDRDLINAQMIFSTAPDFISTNSSIVEIKANVKDFTTTKSTNYHARNVRLYLQESSNFTSGDVSTFQLYAYNLAVDPSSKERFSAVTNITIKFGDTSGIGNNETFLKYPVFNSKVYYANIDNIEQVQPGSKLRSIQPSNVSASIGQQLRPQYGDLIEKGLGYGDNSPMPIENEKENQLKVRYEMKSDILEIDSYSGQLHFTEKLIHPFDLETAPFGRMYEITAVVDTYEFVRVSVPFILFFNFQSENNSTLPECPTVCPPSSESPCPELTTLPWTSGQPITEIITESPIESTTEVTNTTLETTTITTIDDFINSTRTTTDYPGTEQPVRPTSDRPITTETIITTLGPILPTTDSITLPTSIVTTMLPITTEQPVTNSTSPIVTLPPENECCSDCERIDDFQCPTVEFEPQNLYFPDPHDCQVHYLCIRIPGSNGTIIPYKFICGEGLIFCPEQQSCVTPSNCQCTDYSGDSNCNGTSLHIMNCPSCPETCIHRNDPRNECVKAIPIPEHGYIPNSKYYDIYHHCNFQYQDCVMPCPTGLVYCPPIHSCVWGNQAEQYNCPVENRIPYKCKACVSFYRRFGVTLNYMEGFGRYYRQSYITFREEQTGN